MLYCAKCLALQPKYDTLCTISISQLLPLFNCISITTYKLMFACVKQVIIYLRRPAVNT